MRIVFAIWVCCGLYAAAAPTNDGMYATMQTTMGDICFELYYTNVPHTVANFVSLAEGTRSWIDPRTSFISNEPYYNGLIFHRVITNFMIQCGSPLATGVDGPGYLFEDEFDSALRHNHPGVVSMANSGPDTNGGQFFITVANTAWLDDENAVFGNVVEGMNVVSNIAAVATNSAARPLVDITITNVIITRNGAGAQGFSVTNQLLPDVLPLPISMDPGTNVTCFVETAASNYQYIYSSSNLIDWSEQASQFRLESAGDWTVPSVGSTRGFFHANQVRYYNARTNQLENPVHHQLTVTLYPGPDTFVITVEPNNSGTVTVDTYPEDHITSWKWENKPYQSELYFESDFYSAVIQSYELFRIFLQYTSPTNGVCYGYWNDGFYSVGRHGVFTDQDLN